MKNVKVRVSELQEIVQVNKAAHREIFQKAQENYRARIIKELDRRLEDAKAGRKIDVFISLPVPEDHTEDYRRVERMLALSVDDIVELTESEFAQYVQDDWSWKRAWAENTASYASASA